MSKIRDKIRMKIAEEIANAQSVLASWQFRYDEADANHVYDQETAMTGIIITLRLIKKLEDELKIWEERK